MRLGPEFTALIERFSPHTNEPIAIAVSGGSDSLALLHLMHGWAQDHARCLHVFTVDHQLRSESAAEADTVKRIATRLGHAHQTLLWDTPRPSQSAARLARYERMSVAIQRSGARCLLTGHTFDDAIETAVLRRKRGVRTSAIAGASLASPPPVWPEGYGLTLLRPLIQTRRQDLREMLMARRETWIEDPSNANPAYERARVRRFLARHPRLTEAVSAFVEQAQRDRAAELVALAAQLTRIVVSQDGLIDTAGAEISIELLRLLARCASGSADDPRHGAIAQMQSSLRTPGARQTLGGAWFQKSATGFLVGRDPGQSRVTRAAMFDGRFKCDPNAGLRPTEDMAFLVRNSAPPGTNWREIISERLAHIARCYQTPLVNPVQT
ncbi:MAG: tRNA lysidine(34) synthetase TilS [Henriciella sp.]